MPHTLDDPSTVIAYSRTKPLAWWKPYVLGVLTVPVLYLALYGLLRGTGVYYAYYSQGSWEIEGGTSFFIVDMAYFPAARIEGDLHNKLRWLTEPTGG